MRDGNIKNTEQRSLEYLGSITTELADEIVALRVERECLLNEIESLRTRLKYFTWRWD